MDRWIVRWYRYDATRKERRHILVAAFDNEMEFLERIGIETEELRRREAAGEAEGIEHVTGVRQTPGYAAAMRARRQARRPTIPNR